MIRVGINGYGTIGRRVADAVLLQSDMRLVGITKMTPDYKAKLASAKGMAIYLPKDEPAEKFSAAGIPIKGGLDRLLKEVDVLVDATPDGVGEENRALYDKANVKAVFQGGEEHSVAGFSFVAQCNYESVGKRKMLRVVSCNTTALCRVLGAINHSLGIRKARAVLARRAADPDETGKGPIDAIIPDPLALPSHHGPDVQSVLSALDITTMAMKVPVTHMHLHSLLLTLKRTTTREAVVKALEGSSRIMLVDGKGGFKSTASVIDWARESGRPRNDVYEAVVWRDSVSVVKDEVYLFMGVHQEAIVTPENIDAIRALAGGYTAATSMKLTNESLGISH